MKILWPMREPRRLTQLYGANKGSVLYGYGPEGHLGVDLVCDDDWTVYAPFAGEAQALNDPDGYGLWIRIVSGEWETRLAHLSKQLVGNGPVAAGQAVGVMGATGNAFGAHLHWEVLRGGNRIDPLTVVWEGEDMHIGFHGGNGAGPTAIDWRIQETVKPSCFWFIPDEGTQPDHIRRLLGINPDMHMGIRPYYTPGGDLQAYIDQCKRVIDVYREVIPAGQRHLQAFNEPNMPRWAQWEGFGDQLEDMRRFDDWFCATYSQLKRHDEATLYGWPPLTPGNRDVWFTSDGIGHYYMHGPSGCTDKLTDVIRKHAIEEGPCKASLSLADEYYAHIYIHEGRDAYKEPWRGLRFERYRQFFPRPLDLWITEAGFPNRASWPDWGDMALVDWLNVVSQRRVAGIALWILGDKAQWGGMWYDGDNPRQAVYSIREWMNEQGIDKPAQEETMTRDELERARYRRNVLPATMKACDARGYWFKEEWAENGAFYCNAYNPADGKYHCLKLDSGTWKVVEDVAL